jgi:hypothetical protein
VKDCESSVHADGEGKGKGKGREEEREKETTKAPPAIAVVLPEWIDRDAWAAYEEMRKKIRKPMTARAREIIIGKLEKFASQGIEPTAVLEQSIANCWQDVFEPRTQTRGSNGTNRIDAAMERQRISQQNIRAAVERATSGHDAWGTHGASAGFLSQPDVASGDTRLVPQGVGTDRAQVQPQAIRKRPVELHASLGFLSDAQCD